MIRFSIRRLRHTAAMAASGAALAAAVAVAVPAAAATSHTPAGRQAGYGAGRELPVVAGTDYLALGDSVSFGYREPATAPPPDYAVPGSFAGFPEDVAAALGLHVANASCPGETSASLINDTAPSNGCENSPGGQPGYRSLYPLHVSYSGSQLSFAVSYLEHHPRTRLVTLMIGANDAFLCEETTADRCASELPRVLRQVSGNVAAILRAIRYRAHYRGQIALVYYYSLDYANATDDAQSQALNQAMADGAAGYHTEIANGYAAMAGAARYSGNDTCTAGLLTQLTTGGCGIHPSVAGQDVLAQAVEAAVYK
ncbi:MAG TPA: SGNH/GDSL hydrolase family protein [Streptosporangiaceae bacterium]|nr:SGNH/GDSL hydrolase family protein [Streptosporangiaceae bacterium]